jgi:hypothetical protein
MSRETMRFYKTIKVSSIQGVKKRAKDRTLRNTKRSWDPGRAGFTKDHLEGPIRKIGG